jgi:hypothetical protein
MSRREFGFGARAAALQGGRDLGRILFACTARVSGAASRRGVNFARYSASRCFSTSARTSASVAVVMIVRMMIGRDRSVRLYNMAAKPSAAQFGVDFSAATYPAVAAHQDPRAVAEQDDVAFECSRVS